MSKPKLPGKEYYLNLPQSQQKDGSERHDVPKFIAITLKRINLDFSPEDILSICTGTAAVEISVLQHFADSANSLTVVDINPLRKDIKSSLKKHDISIKTNFLSRNIFDLLTKGKLKGKNYSCVVMTGGEFLFDYSQKTIDGEDVSKIHAEIWQTHLPEILAPRALLILFPPLMHRGRNILERMPGFTLLTGVKPGGVVWLYERPETGTR